MVCTLITTSHLPEGIWFREDEDFKVGMNYVALVVKNTGVRMLSFILMSNHVHFLVECLRREADEFITQFKRRYSIYYQKKYGTKEFLRRNTVDFRDIPYDGESLERAIAYVQMNSVAANICLSPTQYPWGTGDVFFSNNPTRGEQACNLSKEFKKRITHSHDQIPDTFLINNEYILPSSYVEVEFVERLFRTPKRMQFFLVNSSKAKVALSAAESHMPSFRDQSILAAIPDLCRSLFHLDSLQLLSDENKSVLLKEIRRRFSTDIGQIGRVLGLEYPEIIRLLNAF